jgi:tRNA A-37 threonylcarbamoyl transferase component Bud32
MTLEVFEASDRFRLQRSLGSGGFGVVYEAYDTQRHARVALKLLRHADPGGLFRLKREFRTLADLSHPNLVMLHELVADREPWFIVMELVDGVDFLSFVSAGKFLENAEDATGIEGLAPDEVTGAVMTGPRPVRASREVVCDLDRFQTVARQLVDALVYLHAAGRLHCDIKPSNVLVRDDGVLKVLDFGLTSELSADAASPRPRARPDSGQRVSGTPAYMSPEQARSVPLTAASDWYSVGVMFFEALTGVRPFTGTFTDVQVLKTQLDGPPPSTLVDGVPSELDDLIGALMRRLPEERPDGAEVVARMRQLWPGVRSIAPAAPSLPRGVFIGRDREMAALVEAAGTVRAGHTVLAHVHGSSGMGKTALVTRFLDELRQEHPDTVVLAGRCYERESVPYKALDSVVDELSQYLRRIGPDAEPLIPRDAAALARLFPVLRRVEPIALSRDRVAEHSDSQEQRRRGFAAFRDLITRLAGSRPVVLFIDDLHWGDTDSAALLIDLLRPPESPPLLLILSYRTEEVSTSAALRMLLGQLDWVSALDRREIAVGALTENEAHDLAVRLIGGDAAAPRADAIVHESGRSPFFISELARHARAGGPALRGPGEHGPITFDTMLTAATERLSPPARQLLEVLAVFGRPLRAPLASRVAKLGADEIDALTALRTAHLARVRVTEAGRAVEVYHDRIRETILNHLEAAVICGLHGQLAHVLEAERDADPETLYTHFAGADEPDSAARYAIAAADRAAAALAFDRAADLYRAALTLAPRVADPRSVPGLSPGVDLRVKLADALAAGGRGRDAALVYLEAAAGAPASRALDLRRRAAEHFLRSGYLDEGYRVVDAVLQTMGLRLARSPVTALGSLLWRRFLIRMRGLGFTARDEAAIAPESLVRVDACWSVATALGVVDTIRGADFQGRHLLLALRIGDRYRIARALAVEGIYAAVEGEHAHERSERLIARADALAHEVQHPHAIAIIAMIRGAAAFLEGRWPSARERLELAEPLLRESAAAWQIDTHLYHLYYLLALFNLGEVHEVVRRVPLLVAEARERDDLTAATSLRTRAGYLPPLAADDPDTARREVRDAMAHWPRTGFHAQHSWELYALGEIMLYTSCGADAWRFVAERWRPLRRSMLLRIQGARIESVYLRARAALAAAADPGTPAAERPRRLSDAGRDARSLARESAGWARAAAEIIYAGLAVAKGDQRAADESYARAAAAFDAVHMTLHAHVARRRQGEVLGGAEGAALVASADAWMAKQGIARPTRWADMLAPLGKRA